MKGDFSRGAGRQRRSPAGSMPSVHLTRLLPLFLRDPPEGWRLSNGSCDTSGQSRRIKTRLSLTRAPRHAATVPGRREEERQDRRRGARRRRPKERTDGRRREGGGARERVQTPTGSGAFINSAVRLIYGGGRQRRSHLLLQTGGGARRSPRRRPGAALLARATLLTQETPPCLFRDTFSLGGEAAGANGALQGTQTHRCCCSTPLHPPASPPPPRRAQEGHR